MEPMSCDIVIVSQYRTTDVVSTHSRRVDLYNFVSKYNIKSRHLYGVLTIGVPVRIQRRCALSARTPCVTFVLLLRMMCPSSRMTRCAVSAAVDGKE